MKKNIPIIFMLILVTMETVQAENEIVINEIMYNSDGDDVGYVELYNLPILVSVRSCHSRITHSRQFK